MKIWDFPMKQPNVESKYLNSINVEHSLDTVEGLCEICRKNDSEYLFNIGMTHHCLCGSCFKTMLEQFTNVVK